MVNEISSSAGTNELLNQAFTEAQSLQNPVLDSARQQNILQRQQQISQMQTLTEMETAARGRTEPRLDAGEIIDFADDFRDTFSQLQEAADPLLDQSPIAQPVWEERTVEISNPDAVTGEAEAGASPQELELTVEELAQAQEMEGTPLPADDPEAIAEGEFEFVVEQGEIEETITIEVEEEDTPEEVLRTAAEEIEAASPEVEADVLITDEDEVFLEVRAEEAGEAGEFELRDVSGDFIEEELEMAAEQEAEEAEVAVEGLEEGDDFMLEGNIIQLQEGQVELELEETGTAEIEVAPDTEDIGEAIEDFAEAIGNVQEFIAEQPASPNLEGMGARLENVLAEREDDLAQLGIEIDPDGDVIIDENRFEEAIAEEPDIAEEFFDDAGFQPGLALEADTIADRALTEPITDFIEAEEAEIEEPEISPPEDFQIYNRSGQINSLLTMDQGELINFVM
ncbi:flagellar filament capping protein FliD [Halarsenatibacter silvermanii]|uniref:Flagellar capping protein FliD n=1 Tax=Halarsenatibacter silvermanii TaxID=321763 RepID=A0A1G9IMB2_9FIRM|nr:flagellar filament capping protein FliD [Halarsenatibacter silvermanii]SDL26014.1 Flagellar capping protein FliD [Halarsenatibacter silvermanii]